MHHVHHGQVGKNNPMSSRGRWLRAVGRRAKPGPDFSLAPSPNPRSSLPGRMAGAEHMPHDTEQAPPLAARAFRAALEPRAA